jgi:Transposase IS4
VRRTTEVFWGPCGNDRLEFGSRASLWSTTPEFKFQPEHSLGKTGISRERFDSIFRNLIWSDQPDKKPEDMTSEQYRWKLVDDFVSRFNEHRAQSFRPSEFICVDEGMSRW